jgi:N-acetylglucosamine kinase-like BadF-type ATPase
MAEFIIGLDGGWSKAAGVICDMEGRVLARARTAGAAIAGKPSVEVLRLLDHLINELCRKSGVARRRVIQFGLGLNGVDHAHESLRQHAAICEGLDLSPAQLILVNDGVAALWGISPNSRLALVQHGSGLTAAYRAEPGLEAIFDSLDVGRIFDVRREGLRATARMLDGRLPRSLLADRVLAHCQTTDRGFAEFVYRDPRASERFFSLAPVIFQAWADGDPIADEMANSAADDYVLAVSAMAERLGHGPFHVGFGGGTIQAGGRRLLDRIGERLRKKCPDAQLVPINLPAECGAAVMVAHALRLETAKLFEQLRENAQPVDAPPTSAVTL